MGQDITAWLETLALGKYAEAFAVHEIEPIDLPHLTEEDLKEIGLPLGPRRRVLAAIDKMASQEVTAEADPPARPSDAERRHLTVLFCDLVDSTALSGKLDPEDMREVLRRYQDTVTGVISRHDGYVANYLGDGVLAYFGWPRAHEDQAAQAIRAALSAVSAVAKIGSPGGDGLEARAGIATGDVVVGDLEGETARQTGAVSGETPNLAARLQAEAAPGEVVIGPGTRKLIGQGFDLESLGARRLKGIQEPVEAFRVLRETDTQSRFAVQRAAKLTPLIGRESELSLLGERWRTAVEGEGQVALLSGEAGIGKSRITQELSQEVARGTHYRVLYQCSPHHVNTAFHPIAQQFEHAAGFSREDSTDTKLDKLEAVLGMAGAEVETAAALIAPIMSLPADRYPALDLTPQQRKERVYNEIGDQLAALSQLAPVFLIVEDAHWIDPTTLEAIGELVARTETLPVLMLITSRPEFTPPFNVGGYISSLVLTRLAQRQGNALIEKITGGKPFPEGVVKQMIERADGNPLFVEEITRAVMESGALVDTGDTYRLNAPLPEIAVPTSLQASLMARLDRLSSAKEVAQIAACIGREFALDLLVAVSPLDEEEVLAAVRSLLDSQLVYKRGAAETYIFKHALVQDSARDSLLRTRRQDLHGAIAAALLRLTLDIADHQPEVLAYHFYEAGNIPRAVSFWLTAARNAIAVAGNQEAMEFLRRARDALSAEPPSDDRNALEMDVVVLYASACIGAEGYASKNTEEAYLRGRELMKTVPVDHRHSAIIYGLFVVSNNHGKHDLSVDYAKQLLALAEQRNDAEMLCVAHRSLAVAYNPMAQYRLALEHSEQAVSFHDPESHAESAFRYGHDIGVAALWHLALSRLCLGKTRAAEEARCQALEVSSSLGHPTTIAYAGLWNAFYHLMRRGAEDVIDAAESLLEFAGTRRMAQFEAWGRWMLGAGQVVEGQDYNQGLANLDKAVADLKSLGVGLMRPAILSFRAEALIALGHKEEASEALETGLKICESSNEYWYLPELHRHRAAIFLTPAQSLTELCLAEQSAERQNARLLRLRALNSAIQITPNDKEIRSKLELSLDQVEDDNALRDIKEARELLASL